MLKSFPPCSLKPHGAGPFRVTVYVLIFGCQHSCKQLLLAVWWFLLLLCAPFSSVRPCNPFVPPWWWLHLLRQPWAHYLLSPVCPQLTVQAPWCGGGGWVRCCGTSVTTYEESKTHRHTNIHKYISQPKPPSPA